MSRTSRDRAEAALDRLRVVDPLSVAAVLDYVRELREECARRRIEARDLQARLGGGRDA